MQRSETVYEPWLGKRLGLRASNRTSVHSMQTEPGSLIIGFLTERFTHVASTHVYLLKQKKEFA